jgi:hypothetical protein
MAVAIEESPMPHRGPTGSGHFGFFFFGAFAPFFLIGFVVLRVGLSLVRGSHRLASRRV